MKFNQRNGEDKITHFDLAHALRVEAKTIKYHIRQRKEHLKVFGELEEETSDRHTYFLNKKQTLLLMTFVSNNPEAKIYIINSVVEDNATKADQLVEKFKLFADDLIADLEVEETETDEIKDPFPIPSDFDGTNTDKNIIYETKENPGLETFLTKAKSSIL